MISIYFTYYNSPIENEQFFSLMKLMPDYIKNKILKYRKWEDAHGCLLGKCLLMHAVAARKETVSLEDIQYTKFGRPYFNTLRNFDFNISHSENMVACAITNEGRIGIDIEKRKSIDIIDFEDQFSDAEWIHIKDEKFPYYTFYDCWTKKEAILKADGRGMTLSLHLIDTIGSKIITIDNNSWYILKIDTFKNYTCSIACSVLKNNIHLHSVDFKANPINEILTYYKISSRL